ncbi:hypothetical protein ACF0H5_013521 [Mactra antiquata]
MTQTMEQIIVILACLIGTAYTIPAPGHGALAGYCDNNSHCGADECCVSFNQPRGKRVVVDTLDPHLMQLVHGSCQKLGTDGSKCFVNNIFTGTQGLEYDCPCSTGYTCEGSGMVEVPKGESGTCSLTTKVGKRAPTACASGADCADTECCVSNFQPIGKRGKLTKRLSHGHCEPMKTVGDSCLVNHGSGPKPDSVVLSCPCVSGLTCHGMGLFEVPLGERGTCGV